MRGVRLGPPKMKIIFDVAQKRCILKYKFKIVAMLPAANIHIFYVWQCKRKNAVKTPDHEKLTNNSNRQMTEIEKRQSSSKVFRINIA